MVRAFLIALAGAASAVALATPAAADPTPAPCGSDMCTYHQFSDEDEWDDEDWADEDEWADPWDDTGIYPNLALCGGADTAIPFVGAYGCLPLIGG